MLYSKTSNNYGNLYHEGLRQQSQTIPYSYSLLYVAIAFKGHLHIAETSLDRVIETEVTHQPIQISL